MYAYDELDRTIVNERVSEFRDQVSRRLSGELTEDEFKSLRLMNGVYLQLHAYMLRIAIPYGTLSSKQMRALAHVARKYDRGYGHFTTRQNIQYNWIKLAELPDALADLAEVGIHGMQTSGNCIRNVTSDQWAGVAPGEVEDPRIWAEILRQYSTLHPEFSFLPRKFKFAITASDHDRAAIKVHDIGLRIHKNAQGETGFEVLVGGGLGRTPFIGKTINEFVSHRDILSYVEAILRVYNQYGRRDNIYKARIKILVHELGIAKFKQEVEEEWAQTRDGALTLDDAEIEDIRSRFFYPEYEKLEDTPEQFTKALQNPNFEAWYKNSVAEHKTPGYAIVTLSLKPVGGPPGDATAEQLDEIADLAEKYSFG
jgi:sulfite reductase (NADPH) hemoprotein beta-component